jgi:peroxiredoxin
MYSRFLKMPNVIKIGDKAPAFTLPDADLKPRSLKEFLGNKTVLAFFVGAFTSVCTKEMCTFRDSMARLTDLKAQIVGIAVSDPFSKRRSPRKTISPFPYSATTNERSYELTALNCQTLPG